MSGIEVKEIVRRAWLRYQQRRQALATCEVARGLGEHTPNDIGFRRSEIDPMTSCRIYGMD